MNKIELLNTLPVSACKEGISKLVGSNDEDKFNLFFEYIDFCLAKNFPDKEALKNMAESFQNGIIVDRRFVFNNPERIAVLGKSDVELKYNGFSVSRVYVKHESVVYIKASDKSYVVIDALDNSQVFVSASGDARVVVNLYSKATASGATKIINKNKETYDLQD